MRHMLKVLVAFGLVMFFGGVVHSAPIVVDGGWTDWNLSVSSSHWVYTGWTDKHAWVNPGNGYASYYKSTASGTPPTWGPGVDASGTYTGPYSVFGSPPAKYPNVAITGLQAKYHAVSPGSSTALQPTYWGITETAISGQLQFVVEDTDDSSNVYYVGPVAGGQNFDAEFLAAHVAAGNLYLAIGSGQRTNNGVQYFEPGDIQIVTKNKVSGLYNIYGVEVGNGGSDLDNKGATFTMDGNGYATGSTLYTGTRAAGNLFQTATGVADLSSAVANAKWIAGYGSGSGFDAPYQRVQLDLASLALTTPKGSVALNFQDANSSLGQHAFIEAGIDLRLFSTDEQIMYVGWAPGCANDRSYMEVVLEGASGIPEPASLLIWSLFGGAAGIAAIRRRRRA